MGILVLRIVCEIVIIRGFYLLNGVIMLRFLTKEESEKIAEKIHLVKKETKEGVKIEPLKESRMTHCLAFSKKWREEDYDKEKIETFIMELMDVIETPR